MKYPMKPRADDRRLARRKTFLLNRCTHGLRPLPRFLIIGEMKSGTSSLFHLLRQHPMIQPPVRKELHFFSVGYQESVAWYRSHFPTRWRLKAGGLTGEACPDYLFAPRAGDRILELLPNARLIVLLRDPVERAISHYFHEVRMGREYLPIADAFRVEEERLAEARPDELQGLETYLHASYKRRSCYVDQLQRFFKLFPREQMLVLGSGYLFTRPEAAVDDCLGLLDLAPGPAPAEIRVKNAGENRERVPDEVYAYLSRHFEPYNERLFDLLGYRPDW